MTGFFAACTGPTVQSFDEATQQPALKKRAIIARDGQALPLRRWLPQQGNPDAVILAIHGFNDYSHAFEGVGAHLADQGIAVYAYDQRGYGDTPHHGIWPGERNLVRDARDALQVVCHAHPDTPCYLMGESMGGAVSVLALSQEVPASLEGVVLIAPALWGREHMNRLYRMTLWLGAHVMPAARFSGGQIQVRPSDNIEMLKAFADDPYVITESRADTVYGVTWLMQSAYQVVDKIGLPVLLLYGANDEIIPKSPVQAATTAMPHARLVYYEQGFHMLTRDLQAGRVHRDIASWIQDPATPLPSGEDERALERLSADIDNAPFLESVFHVHTE